MDRSAVRETIKSLPLFSKLDEQQLDRLAEHAVVNSIPKKALFFTEDRFAKGMHVLLSGKVKLFKVSEEGKEQTIFVFGPGEPFCLCSTFSDGKLPANLGAPGGQQGAVHQPDRVRGHGARGSAHSDEHDAGHGPATQGCHGI